MIIPLTPEIAAAIRRGDSASGAIPNGTRVRKCWGEPGDINPIGATAVVLASVGSFYPALGRQAIGYFVAWDGLDAGPGFVIDKKLERA